MAKLTQHQLVMAYVEHHGTIVPAKMSGIVYLGQMFGSETSKRCRELRTWGKLDSRKEGKYEVFYPIAPTPTRSAPRMIFGDTTSIYLARKR